VKAKAPQVKVIVAGDGNSVDLAEAVRMLRTEMGIRYVLCEGGPTLYGNMVKAGLIDEKFVTVSPIEVGEFVPTEESTTADERSLANLRPTAFTAPGFSQENAPRYRWMSCHRVGDFEFNRYRSK